MTSPGIFSSASWRVSALVTIWNAVVGMFFERRNVFSFSLSWQMLIAFEDGMMGMVVLTLSIRVLGMFSNSTVAQCAVVVNSWKACCELNGSVMVWSARRAAPELSPPVHMMT